MNYAGYRSLVTDIRQLANRHFTASAFFVWVEKGDTEEVVRRLGDDLPGCDIISVAFKLNGDCDRTFATLDELITEPEITTVVVAEVARQPYPKRLQGILLKCQILSLIERGR